MLQENQVHPSLQQDDTPNKPIREARAYDRAQSGKKAVVSERGKHISTTSLYGCTYLKGSHIDDTTARLDEVADLIWSPWTDSETTRTLPAAARRFTVLAADVSRTMEHLQSQVSRGYYESRIYA